MFDFVTVSEGAFAFVVCKNNQDKWDKQAGEKREQDKTDNTDMIILSSSFYNKENDKEDWDQQLSTLYTSIMHPCLEREKNVLYSDCWS